MGKYSHNTRIFDAPFDEISSYLLGFIAGDGYVNEKNGTLSIHLAIKDKEFLKELRAALETEAKVKVYVGSGDRTDSCRLLVCSTDIVSRLVKLGIGTRKSHTYDPAKTLKHLPVNLHRHFFRGLFDADGCAHVPKEGSRVHMVLAGNKLSCNAFATFVKKHVKTKASVIPMKKGERTYRFQAYGVHLAAKVSSLLYADSEIYLARKKEKALEIISRSSISRSAAA